MEMTKREVRICTILSLNLVYRGHLGACDRSCLPTHIGFDEFRGMLENQSGYFNFE